MYLVSTKASKQTSTTTTKVIAFSSIWVDVYETTKVIAFSFHPFGSMFMKQPR
jgi:hypothetical protein